jgi:predicted RNA-binding Zn-ribbon protein involved in translation (DUF1610 family)
MMYEIEIELEMRTVFANPGSALRAGSKVYPCPTCGEANRLTVEDRRRGYQCDPCADRAEGYEPYPYE